MPSFSNRIGKARQKPFYGASIRVKSAIMRSRRCTTRRKGDTMKEKFALFVCVVNECFLDGVKTLSHRFLAFFALLMAAVVSRGTPARAEEEDAWVQPTLPPDAIRWDAEHPDVLDENMLYAQSAILIEASTGDVLFEKNADALMYPASTTKILTAYIALQMADLDNDLVTISQNAIDLVPPTYATVPLSAGEQVYMRDLIPAMLVRSGNEAAFAIAEYLSGSVEAFADLMNQTAQMLGCSQDTHFTNPAGVQDTNHYTTARDMAIIARVAMEDERFAGYVRERTYDMPATGADGTPGHPARKLVGNTDILNEESSLYDAEATGIKTGFTNAAGRCFVGSAERGGIQLISVVFYSADREVYRDTKKLFEYGFTQVESITPEALYAEEPRVIEVTGFSLDDPLHGQLTLAIRAVDMTKDMTIVGDRERIDMLRQNFSQISAITWKKDFRAPIQVGDVMGTLIFYSENKGTAEYDLVATRSIAARQDAPPSLEEIEAYTKADDNPFPRLTADLLVPPAIVLLALFYLIHRIRKRRKLRVKRPNIKPVKKRYLR